MKKLHLALLIVAILTMGSCKPTQKRNVSVDKIEETKSIAPKEYK